MPRVSPTPRQAAIQAGVAAIRDAPDPAIWRSWEALAEAVIDAATPHLTGTQQPDEPTLFPDDDTPCTHDSLSGLSRHNLDHPDKLWRCDGCGATGTAAQILSAAPA